MLYAWFFVQVTTIPAVLLHCHSALNPESGNGLERARIATQARINIAAMKAKLLRDHSVRVIVFTPVPVPTEYERVILRYVNQITYRTIFGASFWTGDPNNARQASLQEASTEVHIAAGPPEGRGFLMDARAGVLRVLNGHVERVFNPSHSHRGKRKPKRDR